MTRPKDVQDNAVPSGNAMAARVLLRLAAWTGEGALPRRRRAGDADGGRRSSAATRPGSPSGCRRWTSRSRRSSRSRSSATPDDPATAALLAEVADAVTARTRSSRSPRIRRECRAAARRPGRRRRAPDGLRLPRLRLPPAGHRRPAALRDQLDGRPRSMADATAVTPSPSSRVRRRPSSCSGRARRARGAADPPAAVDGVRARRARLPGRPGGPGRRRPVARGAVRHHARRGGRGASAATWRPRSALAAYIAAIRELFEEAGVLLADAAPRRRTCSAAARTALLGGEATLADARRRRSTCACARTCSSRCRAGSRRRACPRRFDARFFAAALPDGAEPTFEGDEVVAHAWLRPVDALDGDGRRPRSTMWLPTSTTLQQLEHAPSRSTRSATRLAPGRSGEVAVETSGAERHPDRHAGRRRRRRPAGLRLPRRATAGSCWSTRATRPGPALDRASRSPPSAAAPSRRSP